MSLMTNDVVASSVRSTIGNPVAGSCCSSTAPPLMDTFAFMLMMRRAGAACGNIHPISLQGKQHRLAAHRHQRNATTHHPERRTPCDQIYRLVPAGDDGPGDRRDGRILHLRWWYRTTFHHQRTRMRQRHDQDPGPGRPDRVTGSGLRIRERIRPGRTADELPGACIHTGSGTLILTGEKLWE